MSIVNVADGVQVCYVNWSIDTDCSEDGVIVSVSQTLLGQVESLVNRLRTKCVQFDMDGIHNVWIVKPGAKSRGRGECVCLCMQQRCVCFCVCVGGGGGTYICMLVCREGGWRGGG